MTSSLIQHVLGSFLDLDKHTGELTLNTYDHCIIENIKHISKHRDDCIVNRHSIIIVNHDMKENHAVAINFLRLTNNSSPLLASLHNKYKDKRWWSDIQTGLALGPQNTLVIFVSITK